METSNHLTESWSQPWQSVLSSQLWRLEHLYWIENKAGQLQRFSLNRAQRRLHERLWYRNDILKARQLGISRPSMYMLIEAHAQIRTPEQIPPAEIRAAVARSNGRLETCAALLQTPSEALRRYLRKLGPGP